MVFIAIFSTFVFVKNNSNVEITNEINNKSKKNNDLLTMNLEQTAGTGDYKIVTKSSWPTKGYKFNAELSKCEKGSELSWDDTKKAVIMQGSVSDKCYVYFDIWIPSIADYCTSGTDLATCVKNIGDQGTDISNIYIHDSSLVNGAGDNSYRYAGGNYELTDKGKLTGASTIPYEDEKKTSLIDFYCDGTKQFAGSWCASTKTSYYQIKGDTTEYQTYDDALSASLEKGYLTINEVCNYMCFGTNETFCPEINRYRIIGVIDGKVKVIKATSIGDMAWNTNGSNTWSTSSLNTYLNNDYINTFDDITKEKISQTTWKVGGTDGISLIHYNGLSEVYEYEFGTKAPEETYDAKIGLMYLSDYGFGAAPSTWAYKLIDFDSSLSDNVIGIYFWLHSDKISEWTISREGTSRFVNYVYISGSGHYDKASTKYGVRPVFYLNQNVNYVGGTGTSSDPIRIN